MASGILPEQRGWHPAAAPVWPRLPSDEWAATVATLHRWTQIVGKVRMCHTPWTNHSWSVPLYVDARGLSTSLIPYVPHAYEMGFDFVDHELLIRSSDGRSGRVALESKTTAAFYAEVLAALTALGIDADIHPVPSEIPDAVPFPADTEHATYVPEHAQALWRALVQAHRVFLTFRAEFRGKVSPVHFFWGSFDLAVTRFSGREAPPHPGGMPNFPDDVAREAYSHEVTSLGFWPGTPTTPTRSSTPTPTHRRTASPRPRCSPTPPCGCPTSASSSCPTRPCAPRRTPTAPCWPSPNRPTLRPRPCADWDDAVLCDPANRLGAWWHGRRTP